jgi:uncharacterized protein (TIGR03086 family)
MDTSTIKQACDSTERVLSRITPEQYSSTTPCSEWSVHDVVNHLIGTLWLGTALLSDSPPTVPVAPGDLPPTDLVGDDHMRSYRTGVDALLVAASEDALNRLHQTPLGEIPGTALAGFTTLDIAVHGWDLAKATGQDATLDDDLAEQVLAFGRVGVTDDSRGTRIAAAVPVDDHASATDRLVAFLGRTP